MPIYVFRRLAPEEFDAAYAILVEVTDWLLSNGIRQWLQPLPAEVYAERHHAGENYGLFIDDVLGSVVSLMDFRPDYWSDDLPETPYRWMATLATARAFKGQKLGELTLSEAEHYLTTEGVPAIYLDCLYGNGKLPQFYTSLGYKQIVRREIDFPSGVFDGILMRKKLTAR